MEAKSSNSTPIPPAFRAAFQEPPAPLWLLPALLWLLVGEAVARWWQEALRVS